MDTLCDSFEKLSCSDDDSSTQRRINLDIDVKFLVDTKSLPELVTRIDDACHNPNKSARRLLRSIEDYLQQQGKSLFQITDDEGNMILHLAARNARYNLVYKLFKLAGERAKDIVLQTNNYGMTPLHMAAGDNHGKTSQLILDRAGQNSQTLLLTPNRWRRTALHCAARYGCRNSFETLYNFACKLGIEWNNIIIRDHRGGTVLHNAVKGYNTEITKKVLKAAGNNVPQFSLMQNNRGKTAMEYMGECSHIVRMKFLKKSVQQLLQ